MKRESGVKAKYMPAFIALVAFLAFLIVMSLIHLVAYRLFPDIKFLTQVILILGAIGAAPMLFKKFFFGNVFLAGGIVGFLAECIISMGRSSQGRPSLVGGFVFMLCVLAGFLLGIVGEAVFYAKRKKANSR